MMKKRIEKLEGRAAASNYLPVVLIDQGDPLPPGVGPNTVIIVDDIPEDVINIRSKKDDKE